MRFDAEQTERKRLAIFTVVFFYVVVVAVAVLIFDVRGS